MGSLQVRDFPDEVHRDAKAAAAKAGESLAQWVTEAILRRLRDEQEDQT